MADNLPRPYGAYPPENKRLGYDNADIRSVPHLGNGVTMFERGNTAAWVTADSRGYVEDLTEMR